MRTPKSAETGPGAAEARRRYPGAEKFIPLGANVSLKQLRGAAQSCRGCDLYKHATQAVFGEGPRVAAIMLIGEQPGDQEDNQGRPFVGPAGVLLSKAMNEAGIDRADVYITNVVKHFKWIPAPTGKRRIHAKPTVAEIRACRPWLERELRIVRPRVLVPLGASAAQALLGAAFKVTKERGRLITGEPLASWGEWVHQLIATVHPSSILRAPTKADRERQYAAFVHDLRAVAKAAA